MEKEKAGLRSPGRLREVRPSPRNRVVAASLTSVLLLLLNSAALIPERRTHGLLCTISCIWTKNRCRKRIRHWLSIIKV